jgi:hypothetical protein
MTLTADHTDFTDPQEDRTGSTGKDELVPPPSYGENYCTPSIAFSATTPTPTPTKDLESDELVPPSDGKKDDGTPIPTKDLESENILPSSDGKKDYGVAMDERTEDIYSLIYTFRWPSSCSS